jgi:hypothetical protein
VGVELVAQTVREDLSIPKGGNVMIVGLSVVVGPDGEIVEVREMAPLKPLRLARVMVEDPHEPCVIPKLVGLAVME